MTKKELSRIEYRFRFLDSCKLLCKAIYAMDTIFGSQTTFYAAKRVSVGTEGPLLPRGTRNTLRIVRFGGGHSIYCNCDQPIESRSGLLRHD